MWCCFWIFDDFDVKSENNRILLTWNMVLECYDAQKVFNGTWRSLLSRSYSWRPISCENLLPSIFVPSFVLNVWLIKVRVVAIAWLCLFYFLFIFVRCWEGDQSSNKKKEEIVEQPLLADKKKRSEVRRRCKRRNEEPSSIFLLSRKFTLIETGRPGSCRELLFPRTRELSRLDTSSACSTPSADHATSIRVASRWRGGFVCFTSRLRPVWGRLESRQKRRQRWRRRWRTRPSWTFCRRISRTSKTIQVRER
jgi:hypothetical protein